MTVPHCVKAAFAGFGRWPWGHHPDYGVEYYENLFASVKQAYPQLVIHSIGPSEILHMARVSGVSVE